MPDWASSGLQFGPGDQGAGGIVPKTADASVRNWIYAQLRAWKTYRDAFEALTFSTDEMAIAQVTGLSAMSGDRGPHWLFDPKLLTFIVGSMDNGDPTQAFVAGGYNLQISPAPIIGFGLTSTGDGSHTADYYVVLAEDKANANPNLRNSVYVASLNIRAVAVGGAYPPQLENTAEISVWHPTGTPAGVWSVPSIPSDLLRVGTLIYDDEDDRVYIFGTTSGGAVIIKCLKVNGGPTYTFEDQDIRADAEVTTDVPRFCATAVGSKVMSNGVTIWRAPNRFTPWHAWPVSTLLPGETEINGLFYSATDALFVAMTDNGVWTSPNGVIWSKTDAPRGRYTGAGAAFGGLAALSFKGPGSNPYKVAIATNSFRDWRSINTPFFIEPGPGSEDPIQQIYALDNRLVAVGTNSLLAATLRL